MEITNEIRAKVFAPYVYNVFISWNDSVGRIYKFKLTPINIYNNNLLDIGHKLHLKPLSAITDEDIIGMCKALFSNIRIWVTNDSNHKIGIPMVSAISVEGYIVRLGYNGFIEYELENGTQDEYNEATFICLAYQFLQSKGYDIPHHLLGGKTLYEAGLAIYENN